VKNGLLSFLLLPPNAALIPVVMKRGWNRQREEDWGVGGGGNDCTKRGPLKYIYIYICVHPIHTSGFSCFVVVVVVVVVDQNNIFIGSMSNR